MLFSTCIYCQVKRHQCSMQVASSTLRAECKFTWRMWVRNIIYLPWPASQILQTWCVSVCFFVPKLHTKYFFWGDGLLKLHSKLHSCVVWRFETTHQRTQLCTFIFWNYTVKYTAMYFCFLKLHSKLHRCTLPPKLHIKVHSYVLWPL